MSRTWLIVALVWSAAVATASEGDSEAPLLSAATQDRLAVDIDGVWGIPDQGTDGQGANCDRWATGPGGSPSAISDTDPGIQNQATNDENQIRYGAQDVNDDPPPCLDFAGQSGFGFEGVYGTNMPTDGTSFKLGTFTHYNSVTNVDLADYNPMENVPLTITFSGSVNAALQYTITLVETVNDAKLYRFRFAGQVGGLIKPPSG